MDNQTNFTSADAVKFTLKHGDDLDVAKLMQDMVMDNPESFFAMVTDLTMGQLAGKIAKSDPNAFMKFASRRVGKYNACQDIARLTKNGEHVPAIKRCREAWGFGLKEAKDVVDCVRDYMRRLADPSYPTPSLTHMAPELRSAYLQIIEHFE